MEKITRYKAIDGKFFDDRKKCERYEMNYNIKKYGIHFFDKDFKEMSLDECRFEKDIYFIVIQNPKNGFSALLDILEYFGFICEFEDNKHINIYVYDEKLCRFVAFNNVYNFAFNQYKTLEEIKAKAENYY